MNLPEVELFVAQLLDTGEMNSDTRDDLERILSEARAGQSHPDDLAYLRAFHARIFSTLPPAPDLEPGLDEGAADLRAEIERLRAELDAARQQIVELEARLAERG